MRNLFLFINIIFVENDILYKILLQVPIQSIKKKKKNSQIQKFKN